MKTCIAGLLFGVSITFSSSVLSAQSDIGSDLYQKEEIAIAEIPAQALQAIQQLQADFEVKEAEKELKHGHHYLDLEGVTADGAEIEFDMLLNEKGVWEVVEIQRDIQLAQSPQSVKSVYHNAFGDQQPQRIIESKQMDGVVVYEFYFVVDGGATQKHEIKLKDGKASLLSEEWQH